MYLYTSVFIQKPSDSLSDMNRFHSPVKSVKTQRKAWLSLGNS